MSEPRGWLARVGLTLLAFLFPGSAHVRLGRLKRAAALLCGYLIILASMTLGAFVVRDWTFQKYLVLLSVAVIGILLMAASATLAWRDSRLRNVPAGAKSRWYWVAAVPMAIVGVSLVLPDLQDSVRQFWIPAQSMRPTLEVRDRLVVQRRYLDQLRPGMIVVFHSGEYDRVGRVVALGGQRIELRGGCVIVDGWPATVASTKDRHVFCERLRGERGSHLVRDEGYSSGDDYGPAIVPPSHVFVLGDNRDNSADSRFSLASFGVTMVPVVAVIGHAKFIVWSRDRSRIGRSLED